VLERLIVRERRQQGQHGVEGRVPAVARQAAELQNGQPFERERDAEHGAEALGLQVAERPRAALGHRPDRPRERRSLRVTPHLGEASVGRAADSRAQRGGVLPEPLDEDGQRERHQTGEARLLHGCDEVAAGQDGPQQRAGALELTEPDQVQADERQLVVGEGLGRDLAPAAQEWLEARAPVELVQEAMAEEQAPRRRGVAALPRRQPVQEAAERQRARPGRPPASRGTRAGRAARGAPPASGAPSSPRRHAAA
jgi:hypothetical protein